MSKKGFLINLLLLTLFILIFLRSSGAITVALNEPLPNAVNITSRNTYFLCTVVSGGSDLDNLTFYASGTNFPTTEKLNDSAVTLDQPYAFYIQNIPNGIYEWNCTARDVTNAEVTVALSNQYTVSLYIDSKQIPNFEWPEDTSNSSLNISEYFTYSGDLPVAYAWSGNSNIAISQSNEFITFTPNANWTGTETITFTATETNSNPAVTNTTTVLLNVTNVNDPPYLKQELQNISWNQDTDEGIDLDDYFTDTDGDVLSYSISSLTNINATIDNSTNTLTLTPNANWTGTETTTIIASDLYLNVSASVNLIVKASQIQQTNTPPNIDTYSPTETQITLDQGSTQTFSITKSDPESNTLTVKWYVDGVIIGGVNSDSYIYVPSSAGTYQLKAEVSDGTYTAQQSWTLIVKASTGTPTPAANESKPICGDDSIDVGENCENCPNDVKCREGEICKEGKCTLEEKVNVKLIGLIIGGLISTIAIISLAIHYLQKKKNEDIFKPEERSPEKQITEKPAYENIKVSERPAVEVSDYDQPKVKQEAKPEKKTKSVKLALLRNYVGDCLRKNEPIEKIRKRLEGVGWEKEQIDTVLKELLNKK